jgi:hypothetical protein
MRRAAGGSTVVSAAVEEEMRIDLRTEGLQLGLTRHDVQLERAALRRDGERVARPQVVERYRQQKRCERHVSQ